MSTFLYTLRFFVGMTRPSLWRHGKQQLSPEAVQRLREAGVVIE